ncbi:hypothetical protein C0214_13615 [Methylobacterium sp. DM1]|nr:hypothetical protein C0214_13615 [Methylobacterium sp. DM1]
MDASWHHVSMAGSDEHDGYPSDQADRFQVRMPPGLRDRIKAAAEANNRSMNAEIVSTLSEKYPEPDNVQKMVAELRNIAASLQVEPSDEKLRLFNSTMQTILDTIKHRQDTLGKHLQQYRDAGLLPNDSDP